MMIRLVVALALVCAPLAAEPLDIYCDPDSQRVLGVTVAGGPPPPLVDRRQSSVMHRDSEDSDLLALAVVPIERWICASDTVREMTAEELATLPAPGAEARARALVEIDSSLLVEALLSVLATETGRTEDELLREAVREHIRAREPEPAPKPRAMMRPGH